MAGSILDSVGDISSILAAYEANKAKGNLAQAGAQQNQARAAADIYRTNADVALKGPLQSAKAAATGDQMANIQPFSWTGGTSAVGNIPVPQSTGGLTPANFGPSTRKAGSDLATLSANRVSDPAFDIPKPPTLDPLPQQSGLDSVLGTAGLLGQLAKAAGGASGPGGGSDISKMIEQIKNAFGNKSGTNGNTGKPMGDFPSMLEDPFNGQGNTGMPTGDFTNNLDNPTIPGVDTSYDFNADPNLGPNNGQGTDDQGGYYDENGNYIDPFSGGGTGDWSWGE